MDKLECNPYGKLYSISWKDLGNIVFGKKDFRYMTIYGLGYKEVIQDKWNERKRIRLKEKLEEKLPNKNINKRRSKI